MKITIESTEEIVFLNNNPARLWKGITEDGIEVDCYIAAISTFFEDGKEIENHAELISISPPKIEK